MRRDIKDLLTINVFTNCTFISPNPQLISWTVDSLFRSFEIPSKDTTVRIFIDPHPHENRFDEFADNIRKWTKDYGLKNVSIHKTLGYANGWIKSIELANTPFCFQHEHDVFYLSENIHHDIFRFMDMMERGGVDYLRFNKRPNLRIAFDRKLKETKIDGITCCQNCYRSDGGIIVKTEPHKTYVQRIDKKARGAAGVERRLQGASGYGHMYGGFNHPMCYAHLDGRGAHECGHWFTAYLKGETTLKQHIKFMTEVQETNVAKSVDAFGKDYVYGKSNTIKGK